LAVGFLVLLGIVFLVVALPRITGPIADSDEGINAAVWGFDSRSLRESGIVGSRFGGVRLDGSLYASHPPLIVAATATGELVLGEHPWSTRLPAWLAALASIPVLYALLRSLRLDPVLAAAATVAALGCHMLFVYGSMLDTMVVAFPLGLAVALVWHRQWTGASTPRWWLVFGLATVACLASWQATFLVGLCGVATAARVRADRRALLRAAPYLAAAALGTLVTLSWALWSYETFEVMRDKLLRRTGGESATVGSMVTFQLPWLAQLLGLGLLACVACAISLRDRRYRPLAALSLVTVVGYAVLLKEGAGGHQFWNYWAMFPAAIGLAYVFEAIGRVVAPSVRSGSGVRNAVLVGAAVLVVVVNLTRPNQAGDLIAAGYVPYELVRATELAPGQTELPYLAEPHRPDDWLRYNGLPIGAPLLDEEALRALARDHPDHRVLVLGSCASPDPTEVCERLTFPDGDRTTVPPRIETAADLAAALG
jgi:4-amino-4-deoxy-L-arabinose transferase-like glycosyltransferase